MPTFAAAFAPPPPPEGLTATAVGGAYVRLDWEASDLAAVDFVAYIVERSLDGVTFAQLARITEQASSTYSDFAAPIGVAIHYRVSQENLDYRSDPAEVVTALAGCEFWLVTPGAEGASFEIPNVTEYESEWPMQQTEHEALGRSRKLVESGLQLGEEGRLTAYLEPQHDPRVLELLRAAARGAASSVLLKSPYGEVFAVSLGTIQRERIPGGAQQVSFRFVAV